MTRIHSLTICASLVCATCVWFTASRADEKSAVPETTGQVELLARIEKLEKRIAILEQREQATRQVNAVVSPRAPQVLPSEPQPNPEVTRPKPRFMLLQHIERVRE